MANTNATTASSQVIENLKAAVETFKDNLAQNKSRLESEKDALFTNWSGDAADKHSESWTSCVEAFNGQLVQLELVIQKLGEILTKYETGSTEAGDLH